MARKSKETLLTEQIEADALAHFRVVLEALPDPRRRQGLRYPLTAVVVIALMAMVCGADDAEAMQRWGELNEEWLEGLFKLPHGVPTQDVYLSVFAALDPAAFSEVFRAWVELLALRLAAGEGDGRHLAVDGKTSRRSRDAANDRPAIHTVSAWLSDCGVVVGQIDTDCKTNEITTMPELLRLLDLSQTTVTIDAMGCQREIAATIREGGGDYLLAVKDNQPALLSDIRGTFADALDTRQRPLDQPAPLAVERWSDTTKGHGRIEERELYLVRDLSWITVSERWRDLGFVAMAVTRRTQLTSGKTSEDKRYFIGSRADATVESIARLIRKHWSIENSLHWTLDMAFNEDQARHRASNCAKNMTILRHAALNLLKSERTNKLGVANKRKCAGWSHDYLLTVLAGARS